MAQSALHTCEICCQAVAKDFCQECQQFFCEKCKVMHLRTSLSRNHTFRDSLKRKEEVELCKDHSSPYMFYCESCDTATCQKCIVMNHKGHNMVEISDTVVKKKREFSGIIEKFTTRMECFTEVQNDLEKRFVNINEEANVVVEEIERQGKMLTSKISEIISGMVKNIRTKQNEQANEVGSCVEKLKKIKQKCVLLLEAADKQLESKDEISLLMSMKKLQLEIYQDFELPFLPIITDITFKKGNVSDLDIKKLIGKVEISVTPDSKSFLMGFKCQYCHVEIECDLLETPRDEFFCPTCWKNGKEHVLEQIWETYH